MQRYELTTTVVSVEQRDGLTVITLEDTIFHPQGGGQPADRGTIEGPQALMQVTHVKKREDGMIEHTGTMIEGTLQAGNTVTCVIDQATRQLHSRLHSAGHLLDVALEKLSLRWQPGKGYHFADGPYVEYLTTDTPESSLGELIEGITAQLIQEKLPTTIELQGTTRIIHLAGKAVPCGGTHVQSLAEIGSIKIRNIKQKSGTIRIGYNLGE